MPHYAWNLGMSVAFFFLLLSWFDVSLFAKRINMTIRKCNALLKMSHMIAFDIVHVVRLYSNWEGELISKRISSRLWYINFKTNGWNKTNRWEIVVKPDYWIVIIIWWLDCLCLPSLTAITNADIWMLNIWLLHSFCGSNSVGLFLWIA